MSWAKRAVVDIGGRRWGLRVGLAGLVLMGMTGGRTVGGERWIEAAGWEKPAAHMEEVRELVRPGAGESRWLGVPWLTSVWEARELAAAQGKPIFLWAGSGGGPVGVC